MRASSFAAIGATPGDSELLSASTTDRSARKKRTVIASRPSISVQRKCAKVSEEVDVEANEQNVCASLSLMCPGSASNAYTRGREPFKVQTDSPTWESPSQERTIQRRCGTEPESRAATSVRTSRAYVRGLNVTHKARRVPRFSHTLKLAASPATPSFSWSSLPTGVARVNPSAAAQSRRASSERALSRRRRASGRDSTHEASPLR